MGSRNIVVSLVVNHCSHEESNAPVPLTLYAPDVNLLGHHNMMLRIMEELSEHGEGLHLLEFDVPFGCSAASH